MADFMELVRTLSGSRNDPDERAAAARQLGEMDDARAVSFLSGVLDDRNFEVRDAAHRALFELRPGVAVLHAVDRATEPNVEDRRTAVELMRAHPDHRCIQRLEQLAADEDEDDDVREAALAALGTIEHPGAGEALRGMLDVDDPVIRAKVMAAIGTLLKQDLDLVTYDEARDLMDALAEVARDEDEKVDVRAEAMTQHGGYTLFLSVIDSPNLVLRRTAARMMADLDGHYRVPELRQALVRRVGEEDDPEARGHLAEAIGTFGIEDAFDLLVDWLSDDVPEVRAGAARGLGRLGDSSARKEVEKLLDDEEASVRAAAEAALARLG